MVYLKHEPRYYMNWAIVYTLLGLILLILGIVKDKIYLIAGIIIGFVAYYWIFKAYRIYSNIAGKNWESDQREKIRKLYKKGKHKRHNGRKRN